MKSVVIRTIDDFDKIDQNTGEIEFVEYEGDFAFTEDCILPSITFTKMTVILDLLPLSVENICLYDCDAMFSDFKRFPKLKSLMITNREVNCEDLSSIENLEEVSLDLCTITKEEELKKLKNLKYVSFIDAFVEDYSFLFDLPNLEKVYIDQEVYDNNKGLFSDLSKKGIIISDMFGGGYCD